MTTKEELRFKALLVELGCIVDVDDEYGGKRLCGSIPCLHHPRGVAFETSTGKKSHWKELIPLCPIHHQHGGYGVAFHAGKEVWQKRFGTQEELIKKRNLLLGNQF